MGEITVAAICRQAEVDRATFYRHFETKQDLLERGVAQLVDALIVRTGAAATSDPRFSHRLELLFQEIDARRELYRPFLAGNAEAHLLHALTRRLAEFLYEERLGPRFSDAQQSGIPEMLTAMTVSALVGLIRAWLVEHPDWHADDVTSIYSRYARGGVDAFDR